ncbi:hypothetical protein PPTG_06316 [Phytophthora nicotianae INRA-310]|uniref:Uncharacterized protein n=1 Tax=Phytophthora nicotianae (strain INRA-310) TaxID=761204 RepID=W2QUA8_PHYN3|nr:hypothetical protein PPTG_06316 [Phytophthora nicotianae INRA-310]ETN16089.1 hypothetical protein PPTG_06316 [Phytophthora nicotianae INRA-310]
MDVQTENLRLAMNYAEQKQDIIDALDKQIKREREVFKTAVSANTENTRKLHDLLLKATQGTWVDVDTAALIADLKDRNLRLLCTNRALLVSFAGMEPNTLVLAIHGLRAAEVDLSTLDLDQDTFLALQQIQQEAGDQEDPFALAVALAKTAQQVQSSASKRSRHGSDDGSSDDSSEEKTPVPSGRGSRAGSPAATGEKRLRLLQVQLPVVKVEEFAHELELPEKSGYRFYPVVHVSRLKTVNEYLSRPKTRLTQDVTEDIRLDFDEELLPEDSWEPDHLAGEYEVETILDNRM